MSFEVTEAEKEFIGKKKDKKKDKGYKAFEEDDSGDTASLQDDSRTPGKPKKHRKTSLFPKKTKDVEKEKEGRKEEKRKKQKFRIKDKGKYTQSQKDEEEAKPIFGVPLAMAVERNKSHDGVPLPAIFRECIDYIEEHGLTSEGIYRISGVKSKVQILKDAYNRRKTVNLNDHEPNVVASLLKQYLRELPEPVLTTALMTTFEEASTMKHPQKRVERFKHLMNGLPECNKLLLSWMMVHMQHIITKERQNKMTLQNVSIVLSPTMQISHRVLNVFFLHWKDLFRDVKIKKYVPPMHPTSSKWSLDLPDSPSAIEEELRKQESWLNQLHEELNKGVSDSAKEEQIWEVQRVVTGLKRQLKNAKKAHEGMKVKTSTDSQIKAKKTEDPAHKVVTKRSSDIELKLDLQTVSEEKPVDVIPEKKRVETKDKPAEKIAKEDVKDNVATGETVEEKEKAEADAKEIAVDKVEGNDEKPERLSEAENSSDTDTENKVDKIVEEIDVEEPRPSDVQETNTESRSKSRSVEENGSVVDDITEKGGNDPDHGDVGEKVLKSEIKEKYIDIHDVQINEGEISTRKELEGKKDKRRSGENRRSADRDIVVKRRSNEGNDFEVEGVSAEMKPVAQPIAKSPEDIDQESESESDSPSDGPDEEVVLPDTSTTESEPDNIQPPVVPILQPQSEPEDIQPPVVPILQPQIMHSQKSVDLGLDEVTTVSDRGQGHMQEPEGEYVFDINTFELVNKGTGDKVEDIENRELQEMKKELEMLYLEQEELQLIGDELKQKIDTERIEADRLHQEIEEIHMMRRDDSFEGDSSDTSDTVSDSSDDEEDADCEDLYQILEQLKADNARLELGNTELCQKTHEEKQICLGIKVQIRILQQKQQAIIERNLIEI